MIMPMRFEAGTGIMFDMPDRVGYDAEVNDDGLDGPGF